MGISTCTGICRVVSGDEEKVKAGGGSKKERDGGCLRVLGRILGVLGDGEKGRLVGAVRR